MGWFGGSTCRVAVCLEAGARMLGIGTNLRPEPCPLPPEGLRCDSNLPPTRLRNHATGRRQKGEAHPHRTSSGGEKGHLRKGGSCCCCWIGLPGHPHQVSHQTEPPPPDAAPRNHECRKMDRKRRRSCTPSAKMRPGGGPGAAAH
jgi:hypothetical protein